MVLNRAKIVDIARKVGLVAGVGVAIYVFRGYVEEHYPVKQWIFWVYLKLWAYAALFTAAVVSTGNLVIRVLRPGPMPLPERMLFTFAAGILAFFHLFFLGGLLGLIRPWFCVALPLAMIAGGALHLWRDGKRIVRHLRAARARGVRPRSYWEAPVLVFGVLCVTLVYYAILSPRNIAFDSHFYHLAIAQQYATEHAIRPFKEGWLCGSLPHLSSILYTWAISLPGLDMFGRIVCAGHIEFVIFLMTLSGIPVLVRWLVPRARVSVAWVALFLFPNIFVYDSTLSTAADHIAAFWAVPVYLAFRRSYRTLDWRSCVLLAGCLAGAVLTKYQAQYIVAFPVLVLAGRALWLAGRPVYARIRKKTPLERRALLAPFIGLGAATVAGLSLTAAHWLKNWAFYGDPLFPYLHKVFHSSQWAPGEGVIFETHYEWQTKNWVPHGTTKEKLKEALEALFTFSFKPHTWPNFHGKVPVFGSLFTLSLLCLPFLKGTKRTWPLVVATHIGVFLWFWTWHEDRYLELIVPWMSSVVAATIALAWRSGWAGRVAISALVGFQVIWGGDAYLIPSHAMTRATTLQTTGELLSMGYKKKYDDRFKVGGALFDVGASKELPADARVLIHENNPRLGVWRPMMGDHAGWQYALRYELYPSAGAFDAKLKSYGLTHILTRKESRQVDCLGADIRFFDYVKQDATLVKRFGEFTLYALPQSTPDNSTRDVVAYLGCGRIYERGLHKLEKLWLRDKQLQTAPPKQRAMKRSNDIESLVAEADFVVNDPKCKPALATSALAGFVNIGKRGKEDLWARSRAEEEPEPSDGQKPADNQQQSPPETEDPLVDE